MNSYRHVLVHVNDELLSRQALGLAAAIAASQQAEVTAVLAPVPLAAGAYMTPESAAVAAQAALERTRLLRASAEGLMDELRARRPAGVASVDLAVAEGDPVDALVRAARASDLLVVAQREEGTDGGLGASDCARLIVAAGCPVLLMPHIGWPQEADGLVAQNVLVAWSDTRECARAVRDALPILQRARQVELVTFEHDGDADPQGAEARPPGMAAAEQLLRRHGVPVTTTVRRTREPTLGERMRRAWIPDASIGEALLSHAADVHADLIVMGGYGHSRAWEVALGGVTRTLLQTMTVPVLMSH